MTSGPDRGDRKPAGPEARSPESVEKQAKAQPERSRAAERPKPPEPKRKKKKKERIIEDSIAMRATALAMVTVSVACALSYAGSSISLCLFYVAIAGIGTFASWQFRNHRPGFLAILIGTAAIIVMIIFVSSVYKQYEARQFNLIKAFIEVIAGLLAIHCFDLETRDQFSMSVIISLALLAFASGLAQDYLFLVYLVVFIISVSLLFYFDAVSRSKEVGPSRPIGEGRPASLPKLTVRRPTRAASIAVLVPVLSLPVLSVFLFFSIPRYDSILELLVREFVRPNQAVSRKARGGSGFGAGTRAGSGGIGGGAAPGGAGKGDGPPGGPGNPDKAVNPLSKNDKTGDGDQPGSVGGPGRPSDGEDLYKETKEDDPEKVDPVDMPKPSEQIVLKIDCSRTAYVRKLAFDHYDGRTWSRTAPINGVTFNIDREGIFPVGNANALLIPPDTPTVEVRQRITVDYIKNPSFIPTYWQPQAVSGKFGSVTVQEDGTLKSDKPIPPGSSFEVISFLPEYNIDKMRKLPVRSSSVFKKSLLGPSARDLAAKEKALMDKYRQLPDSVPDKLRKKAIKVAGKKGNWFVKAERIQNYLKKTCQYKREGFQRMKDGDFAYNFLFRTQEGNCVEFATTFVVMARAAGIPARFVGGYLPGKFNKKTGYYEIKVKDGHAWTEIYLPNWSWIPFDATGQGVYPEVSKNDSLISKLAEMGLSTPFGSAFRSEPQSLGAGLGNGISGSPLEEAIEQSKAKKDGTQPLPAPPKFELLDMSTWFTAVTWEPFALAFVIGSTIYIYIYISRQKKTLDVAGIPKNAKRSTLIFLDVLGDLKRYKIVRIPTDTPGDITFKIHQALEESRNEGKHVHPELEPMIENFIEVYHLDRFGRDDRVNDLEKMSVEIRQLVRSKSR